MVIPRAVRAAQRTARDGAWRGRCGRLMEYARRASALAEAQHRHRPAGNHGDRELAVPALGLHERDEMRVLSERVVLGADRGRLGRAAGLDRRGLAGSARLDRVGLSLAAEADGVRIGLRFGANRVSLGLGLRHDDLGLHLLALELLAIALHLDLRLHALLNGLDV